MEKAIFYVDDDLDDLEIFNICASELGQPAMLFNDGHSLLNALKNPPPKPALVFIDLNMPMISGYDVLSAIRSHDGTSDLPVVVLTTANNVSTIDKCREMGASMFVQKPTSIHELKDILHDISQIDWESFPAHREHFVYRKRN
jgi:CheY-like chemotaxis protein